MNNKRRISSYVSLVFLLALFPLILWQRQNIIDFWRLRGYEPTAEIATLTRNITLTDYGRKLFYVHKPQLNTKEEFNENCGGHEQTIVLGCYVTHRAIYIYDVQDDRLSGIEEVTAAHEMLHAGYDRLSASEKSNVDRMTELAFNSLRDARIISVVKAYRDRDPSVVPNELHSILGTEVRQLPTELETYYQKYFTDRGKVVGHSERYESVFTNQQKQLQVLRDQITQLTNKLSSDRSVVEQLSEALGLEGERLNGLRAQGKVAEYNAGVSGYNAEVNRYRLLVNAYNASVRRLNQLIEEYNAQAVEQKDLFNAIDSKH